MKRNIIAGTIALLFCLGSISCNDSTDNNTDLNATDTMTMPAASPDHMDTVTPVAPPAVADTTVRPRTAMPDSMPSK